MLIRDYTDLLDPDYPESVLIAADWLEEQGRYQESLALKSGQLLPETLFRLGGSSSGYAHVYGYERGLGYGYSSGYSIGFGFGYGQGYDYGLGDGYGINPTLLYYNYSALGSHVNS